MKNLLETLKYFFLLILLIKINLITTLPTDNNNNSNETVTITSVELNEHQENVNLTSTVPTKNNTLEPLTQEPDLEASESEQKGSVETPDNVASSSNFDPSIYGGLISPDGFQQYVNQFGAAFPYAAPYPAPVYPGYVPPPPVYPSPYIVQTGYEGYLVPSTTDSTTTTTTASSNGDSTSNAMMLPANALSRIISTLMMSTLFKVAAGIISMLGIIFFNGAIMNFFCNYTPLCDISFRAVTYLKRRDSAERVGRMIAEGITAERLKRAADFVQSAIVKYQELQEFMESRDKN